MPLLTNRTDHGLLAAMWTGDTTAVDELFGRHHLKIYSFLARLTGDAHAAEDLVQELFLRLMRLQGTTVKGDVLPWLMRIARNMAIDLHRKEREAVDLDGEPSLADEAPLALERLTAEERQRHVGAVLAALPIPHREVLLLRGVEGLAAREIGVVLDCSEGAARVRLHRATAAFRQLWRARHGDPQ